MLFIILIINAKSMLANAETVNVFLSGKDNSIDLLNKLHLRISIASMKIFTDFEPYIGKLPWHLKNK